MTQLPAANAVRELRSSGRSVGDAAEADGAGLDAAGAGSTGAGSALPFTYSSHGLSQSVQPLPHGELARRALDVYGSPIRVRLYSQFAFACETLVQPCDTLRLPWSPSDHGAAWMYSPPIVVRWV